jgi:hypothetical protein
MRPCRPQATVIPNPGMVSDHADPSGYMGGTIPVHVERSDRIAQVFAVT